MDCIINEPIRILAHGYMSQKVRYRNIETEIPFLEKESEKHSENTNHLLTGRFNSAELYNRKMREIYSTVKSYTFKEIMSCYYTGEFKKYKYEQIISTCEYLLKVTKLIENIIQVFIGVVKGAKQEANDRNLETEDVREFYRSKRTVSGLISMLWDISVNASDLQSDPHSIDIQSAIQQGRECLRVVFGIHYVPVELAKKMNEPRRKRSRYRSFAGFTHHTYPFIATQASGYVTRP